MKTVLITLLAMITYTQSVKTKIDTSQNITVTITGIESNEGQVVFMLFDKEDGFPREIDKAHKVGYIKEFSASATHTFEGIKSGDYAVAVFHDKDGDGQISTNFMGMPKEPVGASNLTKMSRPSFQKCTVQLEDEDLELNLKFIIR